MSVKNKEVQPTKISFNFGQYPSKQTFQHIYNIGDENKVIKLFKLHLARHSAVSLTEERSFCELQLKKYVSNRLTPHITQNLNFEYNFLKPIYLKDNYYHMLDNYRFFWIYESDKYLKKQILSVVNNRYALHPIRFGVGNSIDMLGFAFANINSKFKNGNQVRDGLATNNFVLTYSKHLEENNVEKDLSKTSHDTIDDPYAYLYPLTGKKFTFVPSKTQSSINNEVSAEKDINEATLNTGDVDNMALDEEEFEDYEEDESYEDNEDEDDEEGDEYEEYEYEEDEEDTIYDLEFQDLSSFINTVIYPRNARIKRSVWKFLVYECQLYYHSFINPVYFKHKALSESFYTPIKHLMNNADRIIERKTSFNIYNFCEFLEYYDSLIINSEKSLRLETLRPVLWNQHLIFCTNLSSNMNRRFVRNLGLSNKLKKIFKLQSNYENDFVFLKFLDSAIDYRFDNLCTLDSLFEFLFAKDNNSHVNLKSLSNILSEVEISAFFSLIHAFLDNIYTSFESDYVCHSIINQAESPFDSNYHKFRFIKSRFQLIERYCYQSGCTFPAAKIYHYKFLFISSLYNKLYSSSSNLTPSKFNNINANTFLKLTYINFYLSKKLKAKPVVPTSLTHLTHFNENYQKDFKEYAFQYFEREQEEI